MKVKYVNSKLFSELINQHKMIENDKYVRLNDCFQRELLAYAISDCIKHITLNTDVLKIIISDVDEIPSPSYPLKAVENESSIVYAEMTQYRHDRRYQMDWVHNVQVRTNK